MDAEEWLGVVDAKKLTDDRDSEAEVGQSYIRIVGGLSLTSLTDEVPLRWKAS